MGDSCLHVNAYDGICSANYHLSSDTIMSVRTEGYSIMEVALVLYVPPNDHTNTMVDIRVVATIVLYILIDIHVLCLVITRKCIGQCCKHVMNSNVWYYRAERIRTEC